MRYVQINAVGTSWADSIILKRHRELLEQGNESYFFFGRKGGEENKYCRRFGNDVGNYVDGLMTRIDGRPGFYSKYATRQLLRWLYEINPDIVHLHVLTGYYINIEMLFNWLATHTCQIYWSLHDCWDFTGHCIHFTMAKCDKWKNGCRGICPQYRDYPQTFRGGRVAWNWEHKRKLFTKIPTDRLTIIVPSKWLAALVKKSYLSKYKIVVERNPVDTEVFKPTASNFRERYGIQGKYVILGVASRWNERKGLSSFVRLSQELNNTYIVVLVGVDKRQEKSLPPQILAIQKTDSRKELAEIYTAADLHVQPSNEETFGMTVAEAIACGTPVLIRRGSACEEAAVGGVSYVVGPSYSDLKEGVIKAKIHWDTNWDKQGRIMMPSYD